MLIVFCIFLSVINFYFLVKILSEKPYQKDIKDFQTQTERLMVEFNRITTRNVDLLDSRIEELNHKIRQSQKTESLLKELFEEAQKIEHLSSLISTLSDRQSSDKQSPVSNTVDETPDSTPNETPTNNITEAKEDENQQSWADRQSSDKQSLVSDTNDETPIIEESNNIINEYLNDNPSFEELLRQSPDKPSLVSNTNDDITEVEDSENQRSLSPDGQSTDSLFEGIPVDKIKKHRKKTKNSQELLKKYIQENKSKEELLEMGFNINEINLVLLLEKNSN